MPNTAGGLPYPLPTDPVKDGATAIQALADALEARGHGQRVEGRSVAVTTNASGGFSFTFARAFSSAPPAVTLTAVDGSGVQLRMLSVLASGITAGGVSGVARESNNTGLVSKSLWLAYVAVGPA